MGRRSSWHGWLRAGLSERADILVTVVVPVKNEERNLPRCLGRLSRFSEVVVVDSGSTDRTQEWRAKPASLVEFHWDGTVKRIELSAEITGSARTLWKIQTALEQAGVEFIPGDESKGPGVRLKRSDKSIGGRRPSR